MCTKKAAVKATVISNKNVTSNTFLMRLHEPHIARSPHSGHFVNILIKNNKDILWRRPFGVHDVQPDAGTFDVLYQTIGRGSKSLSKIQANETLDVIGPLGNTFTYRPDLKEAIIVAGGLGIAPFVLMLRDLADKGIKTTLFYGCFNKEQFCCIDEFVKAGTKLFLTTDDGSLGEKGFVTDSLKNYLASKSSMDGSEIFCCGPTPMMNTVKKISNDFNILAQVTVENMMACGFGACVGCPVPMENPTDDKKFYLACKDGPVFNMSEIKFND